MMATQMVGLNVELVKGSAYLVISRYRLPASSLIVHPLYCMAPTSPCCGVLRVIFGNIAEDLNAVDDLKAQSQCTVAACGSLLPRLDLFELAIWPPRFAQPSMLINGPADNLEENAKTRERDLYHLFGYFSATHSSFRDTGVSQTRRRDAEATTAVDKYRTSLLEMAPPTNHVGTIAE